MKVEDGQSQVVGKNQSNTFHSRWWSKFWIFFLFLKQIYSAPLSLFPSSSPFTFLLMARKNVPFNLEKKNHFWSFINGLDWLGLKFKGGLKFRTFTPLLFLIKTIKIIHYTLYIILLDTWYEDLAFLRRLKKAKKTEEMDNHQQGKWIKLLQLWGYYWEI